MKFTELLLFLTTLMFACTNNDEDVAVMEVEMEDCIAQIPQDNIVGTWKTNDGNNSIIVFEQSPPNYMDEDRVLTGVFGDDPFIRESWRITGIDLRITRHNNDLGSSTFIEYRIGNNECNEIEIRFDALNSITLLREE